MIQPEPVRDSVTCSRPICVPLTKMPNAASPGARAPGGADLGGGRPPRPARQPPPGRYNEIALKQDNSTGVRAAIAADTRRCGAAPDWSIGRGSGRILLTGADRRSYLQGLLTNDIAALTPGTGCYAAMLTAQGRMMTDMRVLELGDAILLEPAAAGHRRRSAITSTVSSSARTCRSKT